MYKIKQEPLKKYITIIILILFCSQIQAQKRQQKKTQKSSRINIQHEIGAQLGIANYQGDFSQTKILNGSLLVNGISVGINHSVRRLPNTLSALKNYLIRHSILKTSLQYSSLSFDNTGISTGDEPLLTPKGDYNTPNRILLGRLSSNSTVISLNTQLEYYWADLIKFSHFRRRFKAGLRLNPYVALGIGVNYVNAEVFYDDEAINKKAGSNIYGLPDNYTPNVIKEGGRIVFSGHISLGARYRLNGDFDLTSELRTTLNFSDNIDGLNPGTNNGPNGDVAFDYGTTVSIGAIYHLF